MHIRHFSRILLTLSAMLLLFSCSKEIESLSLSADRITVTVGSSTKLKADVSPKKAEKELSWSSSNPSVASVDASGTVRGVSEGVCNITVSGGKHKASCIVLVTNSSSEGDEVVAVTLSDSILNLYAGQTGTLVCTLWPSYASAKVFWSSSDTNVAKVSSEGTVWAISKGSAVITVSAGGKSARCSVTVKPVTITLNKKSDTLVETETLNLKVTTNPSVSNPKVYWSSSDTEVASVDSNGKVTALATVSNGTVTAKSGVNGTAVITATLNKCRTARCTAKAVPATITFKEDALYLLNGCTDTIDFSIEPASSASSVTWTSSNTSVATVSKGVVTAKSGGSAIIKASIGSVVKSCTVQVSNISVYTGNTYGIYKNGKVFAKFPVSVDVVARQGSYAYGAVLDQGSGLGDFVLKLYRNSTLVATSDKMYRGVSIEGISACSDGTVYIAVTYYKSGDAGKNTYRYRVYKYTGGSTFTTLDLGSSTGRYAMVMQGISSSKVYTYRQPNLYENTTSKSVASSGRIDFMALYGSQVAMAGENTSGGLLWMIDGTNYPNHGLGSKPFKKMAISTTKNVVGWDTDKNIMLNGTTKQTGVSIDNLYIKGSDYYYCYNHKLYKNGKLIYKNMSGSGTWWFEIE